ncbi:hypothetical protein PHLCEN_2v3105 [Hermanssonia centrifuga]|uniref:Uncharacterized protein n=1 Tax=Hermanssonia centrifuga TaxID=98765 RepID=A0A2R6R3X3_9APHY|nr:hypothetical protein PHLCEN_2v3105 [Hermanssonia centrifuga]
MVERCWNTYDGPSREWMGQCRPKRDIWLFGIWERRGPRDRKQRYLEVYRNEALKITPPPVTTREQVSLDTKFKD